MLIISQNAMNYDLEFPKDSVLRINLAWCNSLEELEANLNRHSEYKIFIDLPIGRIKPPNNKYTLEQIIPILKSHQNIHYFAISNVENAEDLTEFLSLIPETVTIIPKIESPKGVKNIEKILEKINHEKRYVMLDHDDLYSSIKRDNGNPTDFQKYIKILIDKCNENDVGLLRTVGVVFSDDEKRETQYIK